MIDDARKQFLLHRASALCEEHGARLLYLTLSGSLLHGTARPGLSDIDARGLFLPSLKSLALGEAPSHLNFSTALPGERNTAQDMDICLWPVARWLLELLPAGDSDALELLFSPSHAACTLYRDAALDPVFSEPLRLADVARVRSRMERALMKMEKSLSRESSLDTLKNVRLRLDTHASDTRLRLREVLDSLIEDCADDSLCLPVEHEGERGLRLCGRLYAGNVSLAEFGQRLNAELRRFGTGKAKPKAFAHVLRGIMQLEELQHEGRIRYPLAGREELSAIRQESTDRAALFRLLSRLRTRLTALDNRVGEQVDRGYDPAFAKDCALACYAAPPPLPSRQSRLDEISPAIVQLVAEKVDMLERTQNIRVLYACESGSRGWGFASADSDFDVRFIYVHALDWSVWPRKSGGTCWKQGRNTERKAFWISAAGNCARLSSCSGYPIRLFWSGFPPLRCTANGEVLRNDCARRPRTPYLFCGSGIITGAWQKRIWRIIRSTGRPSRAGSMCCAPCWPHAGSKKGAPSLPCVSICCWKEAAAILSSGRK